MEHAVDFVRGFETCAARVPVLRITQQQLENKEP